MVNNVIFVPRCRFRPVKGILFYLFATSGAIFGSFPGTVRRCSFLTWGIWMLTLALGCAAYVCNPVPTSAIIN
jgi:hypothetical protein